jgi:hypothetical protein
MTIPRGAFFHLVLPDALIDPKWIPSILGVVTWVLLLPYTIKLASDE